MTFTSLPVLHRLHPNAKLDPSVKIVQHGEETYLPLCRDCDAFELTMSLVTDLHDRVAQLDNEYLRTIEERSTSWERHEHDDEPTPGAWRA